MSPAQERIYNTRSAVAIAVIAVIAVIGVLISAPVQTARADSS